jgi:hypothetical protein
MKVEMALLADQKTYPLLLEVHLKNDCLEVHGQVPDEASHKHALEVARQSCYLPVYDAVAVLGVNVPSGPLTGEALRQAARQILHQHLGPRAAGLDVHVRHGQISVRGKVASVEEKLLVSRCLHGLPGCTSIVNCLSVPPINHAGHTLTLVTSDGRHVVHGTLSTGESTASGSAVAEADSPAKYPNIRQGEVYPLPPAPTLTLPSGLPAGRAAVQPVSHEAPIGYSVMPVGTPTASPPPAAPAAPAITYNTCSNCSGGMQLIVVPPSPPPSFWQRLKAHGPILAEPARPVAAPAPPPEPPKPVEPPVVKAAPRLQVSQPERQKVEPPVVLKVAPRPTIVSVPPGPQTAKEWPAAHRAEPCVPSKAGVPFQSRPLLVSQRAEKAAPAPSPAPGTLVKPGEPPLAVKDAPGAVKPSTPAPAPPVVHDPILSESRPAAASPPVLRVSNKPAPTAPAKKAEAQPTAPASDYIYVTPAQLTGIVQRACGKLANKVRVEKAADHHLVVHVFGTPATHERLITALLEIPQLAASNVKLEVHVAP